LTRAFLLRDGLLQRRLLRGGDAGGALHALLVTSVGVLAIGSAAAQLDNRVLKPLGLHLRPPTGWDVLQCALDVAGLTLVLAAGGLLWRRLVRPPPRLPRRPQAVVILVALMLVGLSGFALEGLRMAQEAGTQQRWAFVGRAVAAAVPATSPTGAAELTAWRVVLFGHAALALGLLAAVPWTVLRHSIAAPLHLARLDGAQPGPLTTPFQLRELIESGEFDARCGIAAVEDLSGRRTELHACASCGRCDAACPAVAAGAVLSPRDVVGRLADWAGGGPDPSHPDAAWACLQCGACTEACPNRLAPHELIAELRRGLVLRGALAPGPGRVLANVARSGSPYGQPRWARAELPAELGLPTVAEAPDADWVYWLGCAATYDARVRRVVVATVELLRRAGLSVAVLGERECCTGDPARRVGDEARFQESALGNLAAFAAAGVSHVVTHCPHCLHSMRGEYPALGEPVAEILHHSELLARLVADGRLEVSASGEAAVAFHDPCYLARFQGTTAAPRVLLDAAGVTAEELADSHRATRCCGAGGPSYWFDTERPTGVAAARLAQADAAGVGTVITGCPFCLKMLEQEAITQAGDVASIEVMDVAELLLGPTP